MSYGRGGAGNIALAQAEPPETELQPMGQKSTVERQTDNGRSGSAVSQKESDSYFYSGRGGAGNLVIPKASETIRSPSSSRAETDARSPISPLESNVKQESRSYGRGGMGNFESSNAVEREREEALKQKMEQIRKSAERDVEIGLSKPGKAMLRSSDELEDF